MIDSAEGFLYEWWSIFYDVYASRQLKHQQAQSEASIEVMICQICGIIVLSLLYDSVFKEFFVQSSGYTNDRE